MANYLITGGAGFIGSNIAKELVSQGNSVVIFDNYSSGKKDNLAGILNKIDLIKGDIRDIAQLRKSFKNIDYVLHHAALASVQMSINDPITTNEVNINGTINVLKAAKELKVKKVIFAASCAAYGDSRILPLKETENVSPFSPYAISKLSAEFYCKIFTKLFGLNTVILRYFNVFGPNQDPNSEYSAVLPKFITAVLKGKDPIIYGDGKQTRDFVYIENVVSANILAAKCNKKEAQGNTFNIASGKMMSLLDIIRSISTVTNKRITPIFMPKKSGDIRLSVADISKARRILGYKPKVSFESGLNKTIDWYKNNICQV
jgi:UDP-glucose 4-epimerase